MSEYKNYTKRKFQRMRPYILGESLEGVAVSAGQVVEKGGFIAMGDNPVDLWYVEKKYADRNYVYCDTEPDILLKMRSKFYCNDVVGDKHSKNVSLTTLYSDSPEDQQFNEATPSGDIQIMVDKKGAMNFLEKGCNYYVDFTKVIE